MIFAVVITYKAPEKLKTCLDSLDCPVIVVDNSPPAENLLYTAGINKGIRQALVEGATEILICCDDVTVRPGAITELIKAMRDNPECGIACPVQVSKSGDVSCGGCTTAFPYGMHIIEPLTHKMYRGGPYESFWANGACFLLNAKAVSECGLLDENMRFICSDSDYSFTLRSRGWKILMVPEAIVEHEPDGAMHYKNPFIERTKDEDALYFTEKWLTGGLYQKLSYEGPHLKGQDVFGQLTILKQRLARGYGEV